MHLSLSHTLAVVSQEPLKSVPNFPADRVQTVSIVYIGYTRICQHYNSRLSQYYDVFSPKESNSLPVFLWPCKVKRGLGWSSENTQMLLSFPPVAISPRGYLSFGAMIQTQDTKFECPDMQCISVKLLSGLSKEKEKGGRGRGIKLTEDDV